MRAIPWADETSFSDIADVLKIIVSCQAYMIWDVQRDKEFPGRYIKFCTVLRIFLNSGLLTLPKFDTGQCFVNRLVLLQKKNKTKNSRNFFTQRN